jgi:hypothetical protein
LPKTNEIVRHIGGLKKTMKSEARLEAQFMKNSIKKTQPSFWVAISKHFAQRAKQMNPCMRCITSIGGCVFANFVACSQQCTNCFDEPRRSRATTDDEYAEQAHITF